MHIGSLLITGLSGLLSTAIAAPLTFDPLLDGPTNPARRRPLHRQRQGAPGLVVSGSGGVYFGAVRSVLTPERGGLDTSVRAATGLGFGYRTKGPVLVGLDFDLGLGQAWDRTYERTRYAFDVLVQPRLLWHLYEGQDLGFYLGAAADAAFFDITDDGLSQAGIGPTGVVGVTWSIDDHGLLFLEFDACALYDPIAHHYEDPDEETLEAQPFAEPKKVEGAWFGLYRLRLGYRLSGF